MFGSFVFLLQRYIPIKIYSWGKSINIERKVLCFMGKNRMPPHEGNIMLHVQVLGLGLDLFKLFAR
jgi:hypothetical protein